MKKKLILAFFMFAGILGHSQNISQSLGGISTSFRFYSSAINLDAIDQFILKYSGGSNQVGQSTPGFGIGYESYHLEFSTYKRLKTEYFQANTDSDHYILEFYDLNNIKLSSIKFEDYKILQVTNDELTKALTFFSIDLHDIPMSLLNRTDKINILEYRED